MQNPSGALARARHFIDNERQFHLGFLPTEQSHPKTRALDAAFKESTAKGVKMLQSVDRDVLPMARRVFASAEFKRLCESIYDTLSSGGKVVFSGCGATGRLSILLESMWRHFFIKLKSGRPGLHVKMARLEDQVFSIMTGGDYALIRSVESFEDYHEFGRRQVRDMGIGEGDVLVAITEGGETSSVLGTVEESASRGAKAFLLFNNPAELLRERLERCRKAMSIPSVTVLDLHCGPMAIAGSTRMQATTSEQLVAGGALESVLVRLLEDAGEAQKPFDGAEGFSGLLDSLESPEAVSGVASYIEFEEELYRQGGLATYYAERALLDIFTDTTERAPTFMLPPFRKRDDKTSQPSWAFVKSPSLNTQAAWEATLCRRPRCLEWTREDYMAMGAAERIVSNPPTLDAKELMKFEIGREPDSSRLFGKTSAAILVATAEDFQDAQFPALLEAFKKATTPYAERKMLAIGDMEAEGFLRIPCKAQRSNLLLMERLALKLILNTVSSGTMVRLGRVSGNWMSHVEMTNKKLVDRSVRLVSELCGVDYATACAALFESLEELEKDGSRRRVSPVQHALAKLKGKAGR